MTRLKKIAMLTGGVFYALFSIELCARVCLSIDSVLLSIACDADSSWRLIWVREHTGPAEEGYGFDEYNPRYGWSSRKGMSNQSAFDGKTLNTNSRGLRGREEYSYERVAGLRRIAMIGDSFTFGEDMSDEEAFPAVLGKRVERSEVLNFGVHGYGHDQMLLYFRDEGIRYSPDLVVLGMVTIDLPRNLLAFRDYAKPVFRIQNGALALDNVPVPPPSYYLEHELWRMKTFDLVDMLLRPGKEKAYPVTSKIIESMVQEAGKGGAKFIGVFLPQGIEISKDPVEPVQGETFYADLSKKLGIPFLSLRKPFHEANKSNVELSKKIHWGEEGHRIVAESIAGFIERERLLPE
jgi:hypothetical protein